MFRPLLALSIAIFAAGPALAQITTANPFNDQIRRLSPEKQRATMRQAITNSGIRCGRVEQAAFQQPFRNLMMWTATCNPGGHFAIFVGSDQSVQVRPCADLKDLKLPECRR